MLIQLILYYCTMKIANDVNITSFLNYSSKSTRHFMLACFIKNCNLYIELIFIENYVCCVMLL